MTTGRNCLGRAGWSLSRAVDSLCLSEGSGLERAVRPYYAFETDSTLLRRDQADRWLRTDRSGVCLTRKPPRAVHEAALPAAQGRAPCR